MASMTPAERDGQTEDYHNERFALWTHWQTLLADDKYKEADIVREEYKGWDETLGHPLTWLPIFESTVHRYKRIKQREGNDV